MVIMTRIYDDNFHLKIFSTTRCQRLKWIFHTYSSICAQPNTYSHIHTYARTHINCNVIHFYRNFAQHFVGNLLYSCQKYPISLPLSLSLSLLFYFTYSRGGFKMMMMQPICFHANAYRCKWKIFIGCCMIWTNSVCACTLCVVCMYKNYLDEPFFPSLQIFKQS